MNSIRHEFVEVNSVKLHYVTAGNGELVILLHGFPEFWYGWKNQIPVLAEKFKVVAVDMRGYNESEKPKGISNYSAEIVAEDIRQLIFAFGKKKAVIIGHDWGGAIAYTLAQKNPEVIEKLIVLNCPLPQIISKHLLTNAKQIQRSWYMFFFQLPKIPERYISKDLYSFFRRGLRGWTFNKNAFAENDIREYVKAFEKPQAITSAVNYYRAAFRNLLNRSAPKKIAVDTLVIWGENDKALGKELTFGMEKYFEKHFEIKYISNCSHWVQHEYPELVNQYILDFLKKN